MNGGIVLSSRSLSIIPSVPSVRGRGTRTSLSLRSPFILHGSSCTEITGRRNEWRNYAATFGCVRCKKRGETWQRLDPLERRRRDANTLPFFCLLLRIFLSLSFEARIKWWMVSGRERGDGTHEVAVSNDNEVQVPIVTNCDRFAHSDLVPLVGSLHLFAFIVRASGPFLASPLLSPSPGFASMLARCSAPKWLHFATLSCCTHGANDEIGTRWRRKLEPSWVTISRNNWWMDGDPCLCTRILDGNSFEWSTVR